MLGAMGCNPTVKGTTLEAIGGFSLGQLAFSPDGGIYICTRANGAVSRYETCYIGSGIEATPKGTDADQRGVPICIPQIAVSDDEYFWGLVAGVGRVRTSASVAAGAGLGLSGTNEELTAANGTDQVVSGMATTATGGSNDAPIFALFPAVSTDTA